MAGKSKGFTLIELIIVMSIIALLILIFVPQVPAIVRWYRVHLSRVIMNQLAFGVEEYKRTYGEYPQDLIRMHADGKRMLNWVTDTGTWTDPNACHYGNTQGSYSLYLILQGWDGNGLGPTEDFPAVKEFGPIPESPGFVGHSLSSGRPFFEDPFGRPIMYYSARMDSQYPTINQGNVWRHRYMELSSQGAWKDAMKQRGADEQSFGTSNYFMYKGWRRHWEIKLTKSKDASGHRYPYNEKSYVLWMAGADERFGYWVWSDEHSGYIADPGPEDNSDGFVGICDDLTNF